jgi:endonuclease/exonuclease/phosphatase family metal-dependent hydrolase
MSAYSFELLIQAWLDGTLDDEGESALLRLVRSDGALREEFLTQARANAQLASLLAFGDGAVSAKRVALLIRSRTESRSFRTSRSVIDRIDRGMTAPSRPFPLRRLALAATLLLLVVVAGLTLHGQGAEAKDRIAASTSGDLRVMRAGVAVQPEEGLRASDQVVAGSAGGSVSYADGTRVDLDAGSEASFDTVAAAKQVRLAHGRIHVSAAKQPPTAPMVIATDRAQATVVGTRFWLSSDAERTRLVVEDGVVRFSDASGTHDISHGAAVSSPPAGTPLRVMTWNVNGGYGGADLQAHAIIAIGADLIALQQVRSTAVIADYVSEIERVTESTWHLVYAAEESAGQACCIISRFAPTSTGARDIGKSSLGSHRAAARATVSVGGRTITFATAYLDWSEKETDSRTENLANYLGWMDDAPGARILTGGFRSYHDSPWVRRIETAYDDAWKVVSGSGLGPATKGGRIDYVFRSTAAAAELVPLRSWTVETDLSDHRALVTDFSVSPP